MKASFFVLSLSLLLSVAPVRTALTDSTLVSVPVQNLQDTKACWWGKVCMFTADVNIKLEEKADTAAEQVDDSTARLELAIDFNVTSQRGSKVHEYFRIDITQYYGGSETEISDEIRRFPFFYSQRRDTGKIDEIYVSTREKKALARFKSGLVHSIIRPVHKDALQSTAGHVDNGAAPSNMSYIFESEDPSGAFVAQHQITRDTDGNPMLVEDLQFKHKGAFAQSTKSKSKNIVADGQKMTISQKRSTKVELTKDGRVNRLSTKESLVVGTSRPSSQQPTGATPSFGKTSFLVAFDVHRVDGQDITLSRKPKAEEDIQRDLEMMLGGVTTIQAKRTVQVSNGGSMPGSFLDMEDEDNTANEDPAAALLKAESTLGKGTFTVKDLSPLVRAGGAQSLVSHAWSLYDEGTLGNDEMKTVLGSLAARRSPETYDALLKALKDESLPETVRQQAVVTLLHTDTDGPAPDYVVRSVADLAYTPKASMSNEATLLLGSLLSGRPEEDTEMRVHLSKLQDELKTLDPNSPATAERSVALLGALANSEAPGAAASVLKFLDSPTSSVRVAAVDALRTLRQTEKSGAKAKVIDDEQEDETINLLDFDSDSSDDQEGAAVSFLDVGSGQSRELLSKAWNLAGNSDVDFSAESKCGIKWAANTAGGFGSTDITARILDFSKSILSTSYTSSVSAADDAATGGKGAIDYNLNIAGKRVLSQKTEFTSADLIQGGPCPLNSRDRRVNNKNVELFTREIYRFNRRFMLGPVPVKVSVALTGSVGYRLYLNGFVNCDGSKNPSDLALVTGVSPFADLSVQSEIVADSFVAVTGVKSDIHILRGEVPTYSIATTTSTCSAVDISSQAAPGVVNIFTNANQKKWNKDLVNWRSAPISKTLYQQCDSISIGNFLAGRKQPAHAPAAEPMQTTEFLQERRVPRMNNVAEVVNAAPLPPHVFNTEVLSPIADMSTKVVAAAQSQLGVCEATGNNDGIPATRYARGRAEPWCGDFIAWCFRKAGYALPGNQDSLAAIQHMEGQLRSHGYLQSPSSVVPQAGDIIFFSGKDGSMTSGRHAGIVTGVTDNGIIRTIEGNSGNCVRERSHSIRSERISGYGRLGYNPNLSIDSAEDDDISDVSMSQHVGEQPEGEQMVEQAQLAAQYADQAAQSQQYAAQASNEASQDMRSAEQNAMQVATAERAASQAEQIGARAAQQAEGVASTAAETQQKMQADTKKWLGQAKPEGRVKLSGEMMDKLDNVNNAALGVGGQVAAEGSRTRDNVRNQGDRSRDTARQEGAADRSTERQAGHSIGSQISSGEQSTKETVRDAGERARDTVRNSADQVGKLTNDDAASIRREERRAERREEDLEKSNRRASRLEAGALQGQIGQLEKKQESKDVADSFRRNMDQVMKKDSQLEGVIRREEERNRLGRVERDEEKRMDSLKDKVRRDDATKQQQRGIDRLEEETRRKFANEDEKGRFQKLDREVDRAADNKGFERRQFGELENQMSREKKSEDENRRLNRFEKQVEKDTDESKKIEGAMRGVEKSIDQNAQSERRQVQRGEKQIEGDVRRQAEAQDIKAQGQRTRKEIEQGQRQSQEQQALSGVENDVQSQGQRSRDAIRSSAQETSKDIGAAASAQSQAQEFDRVKDETRRQGSKTRAAERSTAKDVDKTISQAQQQSSFDNGMQQAQKKEENAQSAMQRAGDRMEASVADQGQQQQQIASEAAEQLGSDSRQAAQAMGDAEKDSADRTGRQLEREGQDRRSFFDKASDMAKEARQGISDAIKKVENNWDKVKDMASARMDRQENRDTRRNEEAKEDVNRRTDQMDADVKQTDKVANQNLERQLARRSAEKNQEMGALSKSTNDRFNRAEKSEDNRLARRTGRKDARQDKDSQHWQRRLARDEARNTNAREKMKKSFTEKIGRQEARAAGQQAATNQRFGLRMGRSQQMFSSLAGKVGRK